MAAQINTIQMGEAEGYQLYLDNDGLVIARGNKAKPLSYQTWTEVAKTVEQMFDKQTRADG